MTTRTLTRPGTGQPAEAGMRKDDDLTQTDPFSGTATATRHGRPEGHSTTTVADEHDAITTPSTIDTDTGTEPPLTSEQIHEGFFERAATAPTKDTDTGTQPPLTSEEIHKGFLDRQRRRPTVAYEDDVIESRGVDAARGHLAPHVPPKRDAVDVPSTRIVVPPMSASLKADVVARQQNVTEPMDPRIQERAMWGPSRLPPPRGDAVVAKDSTVPARHRARPQRPHRNVAIVGGVVMLVACGAGALATAATCGERGSPRVPSLAASRAGATVLVNDKDLRHCRVGRSRRGGYRRRSSAPRER